MVRLSFGDFADLSLPKFLAQVSGADQPEPSDPPDTEESASTFSATLFWRPTGVLGWEAVTDGCPQPPGRVSAASTSNLNLLTGAI
jgi:hypothetical protein